MNNEVSKQLNTLSRIEKILNKNNPSGKEVGILFLLSACVEVKNTLNGCNVVPITAEQLQDKVNSVISTDDIFEFNSYINFMNSVKSSYNLCTAYKIKVKYRLAGYVLLLERLQHKYECVKLTKNNKKFTMALQKEFKTIPILKEIEKTVISEAKYPYLHNELIKQAIIAYKIEELEYFLLDTSDIENEIKKCKQNYNKTLKNTYDMYNMYHTCNTYDTEYTSNMNIKKALPTVLQKKEIKKLVNSIKNYNFYSPVLRHLYFPSSDT